VIFGLYRSWLDPKALGAGWALGMLVGTAMAWKMGLRTSVYPLHFGGLTFAAYAALDALLVNLAAAVLLTPLCRRLGGQGGDETKPADYAPGSALVGEARAAGSGVVAPRSA
jgi:SSS family solute:Na+ symporter